MQCKSDKGLIILLVIMTILCFTLQIKLIKVNDTMDTLRNKYIEFYNQMEEEGNI